MDLASVLLGGLASGMVLFVVSVGLSVTMGLMGFVNLAHGGFAMLGGYTVVLAMQHWGLPFFAALALGFVAVALVAVILERTLYARLYRASELDQVLFTIGLVFVLIAGVTLTIGPESQVVQLPAWLQGRFESARGLRYPDQAARMTLVLALCREQVEHVVPLVNMVDNDNYRRLAKVVAEKVLSGDAGLTRVVLASMKSDDPLVAVIET